MGHIVKLDCQASRRAREWRAAKDEHEAQRLVLRGPDPGRGDRLVLCGRINARDKLETVGGWYGAAEAAFARQELAPQVRAIRAAGLDARRFGPAPPAAGPLRRGRRRRGRPCRPGWTPAPRPRRPSDSPRPRRWARRTRRDASPGRLAPGGGGGLGRYRRGDLIHRLLQLLPDFEPAGRAVAAARLLAREADLNALSGARSPPPPWACWRTLSSPPCSGRARAREVAVAGRAPGLGAVGASPAGWTGC
ncbi:MAG: hypothetical protein WDN45_16900 [Caulobacteraceae bacterium]